jgi:hypothetical protein
MAEKWAQHSGIEGIPMRTTIVILAGFILWVACIGVTKFLAGTSSSSMATATLVFVIVWFIAAAVNLWIGVTRAGYSLGGELPIFFLIFLLPAFVAGIVKWRFL